MVDVPETMGPVLFARGGDDRRCNLSALVCVPEDGAPPPLAPDGGEDVAPVRLCTRLRRTLWRYDFDLPARADAMYRVGATAFQVAANCAEDLRVAYISCNGQERGDEHWPSTQRNAMWQRLAAEHGRAPFSLLLHGGDQLYADEVLRCHPALRSWAASTLPEKATQVLTADMRESAEAYYFARYLQIYAQAEFAHLCARVPSFMMWDDHDIFDGWGSIPQQVLDSPVGRGLFAIARSMFMLFQHGATDQLPPAACDGRYGRSLTLTVRLPRFAVIAPDLRSERRPTRVMGEVGWAMLEQALSGTNAERILLMSSVPLLGPRLSWIESLIAALPGVHRYEDDLRDQWQSRTHRAEWQRVLRMVERIAEENRCAVTALSGEIHLAARARMRLTNGTLHQLVASGIAHPPPARWYARALGLLARFGESPLPGRIVRLEPLPGQRYIYAAERNYLTLYRKRNVWSAAWELENLGRTPELLLS